MPKYVVGFKAMGYIEVEVEAESEEDADDLAWEAFHSLREDQLAEANWYAQPPEEAEDDKSCT